MKITLLVPDASESTFYRTKILYDLLKDNFSLEVISVVKNKNDSELYKKSFENYKKIKFDLGTIISDLKKSITGDVIYALKARPTSFGFAMSLKGVKKLPVILDIDSREKSNTFPYSDNNFKNILFSLPFFNNTNSFIYTWILEKRIKHASQITVSSPLLQKTYTGTFIPSACDTDLFNPEIYNRDEIRKAMGWDDYKIILFAGQVNRNTDINILIEAVKAIDEYKIKIVIVGNNKLKNFKDESLIEQHKYQPSENIAKLLTASDLVVIPQKEIPSSFGEIPVKLFEAMSSAKVVIAPDIYDFPDLLDDCGLIYKSNNSESLKKKILDILKNDKLNYELGLKAREKSIERYSKKVIEKKLCEFFSKFEIKNADGRT